jgi:hypothetical protein
VEESKHKQQQQQHASKKDGTGVKDKRVWMSRGGKLQQEDDEGSRHNAGGAPPGRLIRSGTYEKLNTDQPAPPASAPAPKEMKARSRSRLSIKLSKFGLTKRRDDDQANGNHHHQPAQSPDIDELGNNLPRDALDSGAAHPADAALSVMTATTAAGRSFRSSSSVSSSRGSLAAAVVAPFNYTPSSSSSNGGLERIKSAAQIKRNSSYVSSMGRRQEGVAGDVSPGEEEEEAERRGKKTPTGAAPSPMVYAGNTSSSVVTLV